MIWYTGHGEKKTGNWCLQDGVISFEDIFNLYKEKFRGKLLTIVSDCCYAGQWVHQCAKELDKLNIKPYNNGAKEAKIVLKIIASCEADKIATDGAFIKDIVKLADGSIQFDLDKSTNGQTPHGIDTRKRLPLPKQETCRRKWKDLIEYKEPPKPESTSRCTIL